jgi:hypothetical protein
VLNVSVAKGKTTTRRDVTIDAGTITLNAQLPSVLKAQLPAIHWELHKASKTLSDQTRIAQSDAAAASFTLAPGKYKLRALTGLNFITEQSLEVRAADKPVAVAVKIEPAMIQLSAFGSHSKKPLTQDVHWSLEPASTNALTGAAVLSAADSATVRFVLQAGHYRVTARHKDKFVQSKEFDLQPGAAVDEVININDDPNPKGFVWR